MTKLGLLLGLEDVAPVGVPAAIRAQVQDL